MKKLSVLTVLILFALSACGNPSITGEGYVYDGETSLSIDGRSFTLEDVPESVFEDVVIQEFLYTITAEFDNKYDILADIEPHGISIENEKERFEDGLYTQSYIIHGVTTLTEEQYSQEKTASGEENALYYFRLQEVIDEYSLVEYKIVNVDYTVALSPKATESGPQWGDGRYSRSFVVGKRMDANSNRIYDFSMPYTHISK